MLLYTDGVTETFNPDNDTFGLKRLQECILAAAPSHDPQRVIDEVVAALAEFRKGRAVADDIAMVCLAVQ